MSESLPLGKLLHSLFPSLLSFTLSSKMHSKIYVTEKTLADAKFIAWIKICLELGTFEEFATTVLQTLAICAKSCLLSCDDFFKSHE